MTENSSRAVTLYTDGACAPNPGRGGYGVLLFRNGTRQELSGGFLETTNNRMELFSVITGLRALQEAEPLAVTIYSDSRYVVDMYSGGYASRWRSNGWRKGDRQPALNVDLWTELLDLCARHEVKFVWVRGHADNADNARCDELAVLARQRNDLPADPGYQRPAIMQQLSLFDLPASANPLGG